MEFRHTPVVAGRGSFVGLRSLADKLLPVLLALTIVSALTGCHRESAPAIVTDDEGRTVEVRQPKRVVSLAPGITEIVYAMGVDRLLAGVTGDCDHPPAARTLPTVGRYFMTSLETILDLDPDLVLTDGHDPVWHRLEELGIAVVVLSPSDIDGLFTGIGVVGEVLGAQREAMELVRRLGQRLDHVSAIAAGTPEHPTVFYEIDASDWSSPWTAGRGSFVDALITLAGGENVVTAPVPWLQFSLEELVALDPDVIILGDYPFVEPADVTTRGEVWPELSAVRSGRVYAISDPSLTSRSGPRLIDGLEEIARMLHPALFSEESPAGDGK